MKLKEYEEKIKNEVYDIPNVLGKIETVAYNKTYSVESTKKIPFFRRPIFKFATIVLVLALVLTITLIATSSSTSYDHKLETVNDKKNLSSVLQDTNNYKIVKNRPSFNCVKYDNSGALMPEAGAKPTINESKNENSETNNQVKGINEPEIIKYDEKYIYYLYYNKVVIFEQSDTIKHYTTISIDKNISVNTSKILLYNDYLIIYYSYLENRPYTEIFIYDTVNNFEVVNKYKITGTYQDARLMDNSLYLVVAEGLYINNSLLPEYCVNDEKKAVDLSDVIYITNSNNQGYTSIVTINLDTFSIHQSTQLGATLYSVIYMSKNKLYLASNIYNGKRRVYESTIYIYNVNKDNTSFYAFTNFDGNVLDQYSLDEYEDMLRVASTNINAEVGYYNSIHIYDLKDLNNDTKEVKRIGLLNEGLGLPYQTIRSATFNKDRASVVTYATSDPLYDIDLSDPRNPKIIGTFEAPGYSSYLHRLSDTYMLGIGYDDFRNGKLSLYHNDTENNTYVNYGKDFLFADLEINGMYADYAFNEPRELMFITIDDVMTFGMPVNVYDSIKGIYIFEYWIFQIDLNDTVNPIKLKLKINCSTLNPDYMYQYSPYVGYNPLYWSSDTYNYESVKYAVLRALFINDKIIGITSEGVIVYDKNFNYLYSSKVLKK